MKSKDVDALTARTFDFQFLSKFFKEQTAALAPDFKGIIDNVNWVHAQAANTSFNNLYNWDITTLAITLSSKFYGN